MDKYFVMSSANYYSIYGGHKSLHMQYDAEKVSLKFAVAQ